MKLIIGTVRKICPSDDTEKDLLNGKYCNEVKQFTLIPLTAGENVLTPHVVDYGAKRCCWLHRRNFYTGTYATGAVVLARTEIDFSSCKMCVISRNIVVFARLQHFSVRVFI